MLLMIKEHGKKLAYNLFHGEVTLSKKDVWIVTGICTMLGVLIGLLSAPLTHGIIICCGNNNGNHNDIDNLEGSEEEDGGSASI